MERMIRIFIRIISAREICNNYLCILKVKVIGFIRKNGILKVKIIDFIRKVVF